MNKRLYMWWWIWFVSLVAASSPFEEFGFGLEAQNLTVRSDEYGEGMAKSSGILNPDNIYEWTPIAGNISAGERNVFVFTVNMNSTGTGFLPTYEILIFLSGNICQQPNDIGDRVLRVSYSFNESVTTNSSVGQHTTFQNGYMQALAVSPLTVSDSNATAEYSYLYVVVEPVDTKTNLPLTADAYSSDDIWEYKLSISENDLVYQWDTRPWLDVLDTDYNSALLATGNVTADAQQFSNISIYDISLYDLYVYSFEDSLKLASNLNISLCAVTGGPYLVSSVDSNQTKGEDHQLEETDLRIGKSLTNRRGTVQEQFYITGLNSSSTYVAYLTKKIGKKGNLSDVGGVLFSKQLFTTRDSNSCSLIFGLNFCYGVAYSVPSPSIAPNNKTLIAGTYDHIAESLYANFSKALQIIACDSELDARYSPIRSCKDCATSYRNWLCGVTIPRCTNTKSEYYVHRDEGENRNDYLDDYLTPIDDYYEILPCIDMCYAIARDCPSDFGFSCPSMDEKKIGPQSSYSFFNPDYPLDTCNFIGNSTELYTNLNI